MADTSDFRNGLTIVWNGDLWTITEFMHVKPGKGGAFVRSKLKNVRTGRVVDNTFRAGEKVDTARVERRPHQFLYEDDLGLHLMNTETYEQLTLPADSVEGREFIKECGTIDVLVHAETDQPLSTEISNSVVVASLCENVDPPRRFLGMGRTKDHGSDRNAHANPEKTSEHETSR